ncbi:hypothetical protein D3C73_1274430 [compost metagenome]
MRQRIGHLQRIAQGCPVVAVQTIGEVRLIGLVGEVTDHLQVDSVLVERHIGHLGRGPGTGIDHHNGLGIAGHLHADEAVFSLKSSQSGNITVLHPARLQGRHACALRSERPLGQRVPGIQLACAYLAGGQPHEALALGQGPLRVIGIVVPLPDPG